VKSVLVLLILEIFKRHQQHTKTFAMFFSDVFVMHFVGASYRSSIAIVCISEEFESLVNEDVVHQEIRPSVGENAQSDGQTYC
jgi:hypothetical protein